MATPCTAQSNRRVVKRMPGNLFPFRIKEEIRKEEKPIILKDQKPKTFKKIEILEKPKIQENIYENTTSCLKNSCNCIIC